MYNGEPKPEPELETEPEPENLLKPSWDCMSRTSPTLRLPKNDATLGPPDGQPQPEACKRKMADPTKHLLSFPEQSLSGLVWQGPTPLRGSQNRSHAGAPCWTSLVRGLRLGKLGCPWGSDMNRRAGLVVAILPHDTGFSRCLSRGSRTAVARQGWQKESLSE